MRLRGANTGAKGSVRAFAATLPNDRIWHNSNLRLAAPEGQLTSGLPTFGVQCRFTVAFLPPSDRAVILIDAEHRMADEYDAAQERGEFARHGQKRADVAGGNISADLGPRSFLV